LPPFQKNDSKEGRVGLCDAKWRERYDLEKALMQSYAAEEAIGIKWVVKNGSFNWIQILPSSVIILM
jgi:hypothetical protein